VLAAERNEVASAPVWNASEPPDAYQAWLDADRVRLPLNVRARKPGERFCPLGMNGHSMKLSDFMVNIKMPARARAGWPLVFSGDELVWVPGYRQNHAARLTVRTGSVLVLSLRWQA
jgi:tRNA(Ile)-lysidine synthase